MQLCTTFFKKCVAEKLRRCSSLKQVESWHCLMLKNNLAQDCFLINQYITSCARVGSIDSASFSFFYMDNPNVFVYNSMFGALVNSFRPIDCLWLYLAMMRNGTTPSSYTFPTLIKSCKVLSLGGLGVCIHGQVMKFGFGLYIHIQTVLVDFYSSLGKLDESRRMIDEMHERDDFAVSTMVLAYARAGDLVSARKVFDETSEKKSASWNALINSYVEAGDLESAEHLFYRMSKRDVISWTTMIKCYCKHNRYLEALQLFDEMKDIADIKPDEVTMATVLSACAHLGALDKAKEMHLYVMQNGFTSDVYIGSALIDMYAKCGMLEKALVVFYKLQKKNIFCWSSMIDGLAFHGCAKEALAMFEKMREENVEPNNVIFVSILAACTHAGLVDEGKQRFQEMTSKYSIVPGIEHYGCMVDLFCRVGLLEEALCLIKQMKMEPNSVIWGTLLGGCKLHKNMEIAQIAVEKLMILEPNNSGYYNLLISMCAEANQWNEVSRLRTMMKEKGVEKTWPGSSWIEVDMKMHQFAACSNHSAETDLLLDVIDYELKLFGHEPLFDFLV